MNQDTLSIAQDICRSRGFSLRTSLGRGAVGEVYLVNRGGARYALKVLAGDSRPGSESFEREMRALIDHPNPFTVRIYEFGVTPAPWYLMDHYDASLAGWIEKHPDRRGGEKAAWQFLSDALTGLAEWHGRSPRVLHGDVNPGNILVDEAAGRAVLADPSLAALCGPRGTDLTGGDLGGGTPGYADMATPPRTPARDVYAMGATLYATLSRTVALPPSGLFERVRDDEALAESHRRLVLAALSADPAVRPPDARALLAAFQNASGDEDEKASAAEETVEPLAKLNHLGTGSYALGIAALVAVIALGMWLGSSQNAATHPAAPTPVARTVTTRPAPASTPIPRVAVVASPRPTPSVQATPLSPATQASPGFLASLRERAKSFTSSDAVAATPTAATGPSAARAPAPPAEDKAAIRRPETMTPWELIEEARNSETRGNRERAQDLYRRAAAFDETRPNANRALGLMYFRIGAFAGAIDHLERYLALRPEAPDRREIQQLIDRARS